VRAPNNNRFSLVRSSGEIAVGDSYRDLQLETRNGTVKVRLYEPADPTCAVIMVAGVGGDFDTPANQLYPKLGGALEAKGIAAMRVQFRVAIDLDDSMLDLLAALEFLRGRGISRTALVGYSFGGAVAIQAALRSSDVVAVVTLATQGFGTEGVEDLAPRPILFIHGYDDEVLPPACSIDAYNRAGEPKTLKLFEGARHVLDECAQEVYTLVLDWLLDNLKPGPADAGDPGAVR